MDQPNQQQRPPDAASSEQQPRGELDQEHRILRRGENLPGYAIAMISGVALIVIGVLVAISGSPVPLAIATAVGGLFVLAWGIVMRSQRKSPQG